MNALSRSETRSRFPDLSELFESPFLALRPSTGLRVETAVRDGRYVVRVEVPGVDPDEDVKVMVSHGSLTIEAERAEPAEGPQHSEFRYGSFSRTLPLPQDADDEDISATYDRGVLEVTVGLSPRGKETRRVPITRPSPE